MECDFDTLSDFFSAEQGPALIHGAAPFTPLEWRETVRMVCRDGRALPALTHRYHAWREESACGCTSRYCTLHRKAA